MAQRMLTVESIDFTGEPNLCLPACVRNHGGISQAGDIDSDRRDVCL
ncbi:hypothetical protein QA635_32900 [Bradyrhizobium brasilense]|nr:hypothetical protein [Bradyrhizobium australafricanum]WFU31323.1 hypothetical protein QA635_32900 [Bradyrhizobium australafricanum]